MRIPPGLIPNPVTSTRDAAAAGGALTTPVAAISRLPANAVNAVLNPLIGDLRSAIPLLDEVRQTGDDRQRNTHYLRDSAQRRKRNFRAGEQSFDNFSPITGRMTNDPAAVKLDGRGGAA
jgi:hypothetical protein